MLAEFARNAGMGKRGCARSATAARSEMSTAAALDIAAAATPQTAVLSDPNDPNGRKPGDRVEVMPDDYGKDQSQRRDRRALVATYRHSQA